MRQAANLRWALAVATLLAASGWTQAVHAQSVVVTLNGVETIGVSDTGGPRPSALINRLETIGVLDAGGPFASAFLRANEAVAVADVGALGATVGANRPP